MGKGFGKHGNLVTASFLNINATKLDAVYVIVVSASEGNIPPTLLVFNLNVLVASARCNIRRLRIGLRY